MVKRAGWEKSLRAWKSLDLAHNQLFKYAVLLHNPLLLLFSCSVVSDSLQPHALQSTRLACPSLSPRVCSDSCPLSQWHHPTISFCHPLLLLTSIFPSIRVFSNELSLCIRWWKYWSFTFSISFQYSGLIPLGLTGLISVPSKGLSRTFSSTTIFLVSTANLWSLLTCCFLLNSSTWSLSWSSY